jgi:hypothetical protein
MYKISTQIQEQTPPLDSPTPAFPLPPPECPIPRPDLIPTEAE